MSTKEQEEITPEMDAPANEQEESTAQDNSNETTSDQAEETAAEEVAEEDLETTLRNQVKEWNDKYLRLYSEFENFRRRTARERLDLIKTAGEDIVKDMLPVLDDLERAMESNEKVDDIEAVKEGFKLVYNKYKNVLVGKGLKEIEAKEQAFDLDLHEALTKIPAPSDDLKGKVVDVLEKGYYLNDKVIRYSKVVIGE